jgi:glucose-1-phosphate thymidylyltransferase
LDSRQLVFICGGKGTRLRSGSGDLVPKSLTEVGGEPIVSRLIRTFLPLHTSEAAPVFIVAQGDSLTPQVIHARLGSKATIVEQAVPDGVANAVLLAASHLRDTALVFLGDIILEGEFSQPLPSESAVCVWKEAPDEATHENFGVRAAGGVVVEMVEKPANPKGLACGIGVYALTQDFIAQFANAPINPIKGEREITEALKYAVSRGHPLGTFEFSGIYVNINRLTDRTKAEEILNGLRRR